MRDRIRSPMTPNPAFPGQEPHRRTVGNVTYHLASPVVGPIRIDGDEIIRRIFVTVRSAGWVETPPQDVGIEEERPGYVRLSALYCGDFIEFQWSGTFEIDPVNCAFSFTFDGKVLREGSI